MSWQTTDHAYLSTDRSFQSVLKVLGQTPEQVRQISENTSDFIDFPFAVPVMVADSPVDGKGLFALMGFKPGDLIAPARLDSLRTPAGRFTNHSGQPNAEMVMRPNGDVDLVAIKPIEFGEEIFTDYYFSVTRSRPPETAITKAEAECVTLLKELFPKNLDAVGVAFPDPLAAREKIVALEAAMARASSIQLQIQTTHRFIDGVYAREVFIPKGTLLVGRIHRHACISIMSKGDKSVATEDGAMRLRPPFATISKPGTKRVGFAHEDSIWTTIHATTERDLKKVEQDLFVDTYEGVEFKDPDNLTLFTMEGKICRE